MLRGNNGGSMGVVVKDGDIILGVNGKEVHTPAELDNALSHISHQFQITLLRGGSVVTLTVMR